jgi:hypothetical protein
MRAFLPALLALAWTTLLVQFLFLYVSAFREGAPSLAPGRPGAILATIPAYLEIARVRGLVSVQVTNLLLLGPVLLLLRRWRPPFGVATLLFAMVATLVAIVDEFARWEVVVVGLAGGLAADWLIAHSARWPNRTRAHRAVAIGTRWCYWPHTSSPSNHGGGSPGRRSCGPARSSSPLWAGSPSACSWSRRRLHRRPVAQKKPEAAGSSADLELWSPRRDSNPRPSD